MSNAPEPLSGTSPTVADLLGAVTEVPGSADILRGGATSQRDTIDAEFDYTHLIGLQDHYGLKKIWAIAVMGFMLLMIGFQCVLLSLVGAHIWSFTDYKWLLPALLVQNLAQITGLAFIVVKALFNSSMPIPTTIRQKRG